ncbi:ROK family transcriptional regulator [Arthrobacter sp. TWP1-1]|uniref:ROK family transcriptional regulator n=1 Tax=Arthrobacter sp. TWP1-1 TaxID=2804568 RepID=UPI003CF93584
MQTKGGALKGLRTNNRRQVLELLLNEGPMHRAELARRMKTSRTTITNITNELLEREIVLNRAPDDSGHGHELIAINPGAGYSLGMDFTLDKVAINVSDLASNTVAETSLAVDVTDTAETRVAAAAAVVRELLSSSGIADSSVVGIGVGVPGQIDRRTDRVGGSIPGQAWSLVDVRTTLANHLPFPIFLENNSRLEGFAEKQWGAGKDSENMLYLNFSSGVGMALFDDGRLFRGSIGAAGEVGHMSTDLNGPVCPCGNRGCLVLRTGTAHVLALLRPALGATATWDDVLTETQAGNVTCLSVLSEIGTMTGRFLAGISNLLDPELMVIGGELAQTGEPFMGPLASALKLHTLPLTGSHVTVVQAALPPGAATGARGGAALALREMAGTSSIDRLGA